MNNFKKPTIRNFEHLSFLLIICFCQLIFAQQKAFPGAVGAGALATGGRGGTVLHVTNLDWNNNPGSLKWAIEQPYPRTIVFDVSGTIDTTGEDGNSIYSFGGQQYSNMTIAGQTAPEGGITIEHNYFAIGNFSNVIIRYIRFVHVGYFRPAGVFNATALDLATTGHSIADHISTRYSWNSVALQHRIAPATNGIVDGFTVQNSIFGDCKTGMLMGPAPNLLDNVLQSSGDYTVSNNLFAHISHRFPNITGNGTFEIINNVAYNHSARLVTVFNDAKVNMIGNYYKKGPHSVLDVNKIATYIDVPSPPQMQVYTRENIVTSTNYTKTDTSWDGLFVTWANNSGGQALPPNEAAHRSLTQFADISVPVTIQDPDDAYNSVLSDVGANKYLNADGTYGIYIDSVDQSYIDDTTNGTGVYKNLGDASELVYPTLPNITRPSSFYQSNPHIPEVWFQANVPPGQDHNDIAPSGYTWLEEYLNGVDDPVIEVEVTDVEIVTPVGFVSMNTTEVIDFDLIVNPSNATDTSGQWTSSDTSVATVDQNGEITALGPGTVTITFTSNSNATVSDSVTFEVFFLVSAGDDISICSGESTTLSATGGTVYTWDTGATGPEITVIPTVTTTYTVTVEDVFGNSETDSVTVTVNETPDITVSSDIAIMEGESTVLSSSGWTDYEWSTGETTASITVSPTVTTTYTVSATNPSGGCSDTESVTVTVVPELIADAGADVSICSGESTTLSATGGTVYTWDTGATGPEITVSPTVTTTYTVTVEDVLGNTETDSVTVTVNETPDLTVSVDITIMDGDSTVLTASGWTDYEWSTGETTTSITVSPTVTTTYTVSAINPSGGCSDTESVTVTVIPELIADAGADVSICSGESITLSATGGAVYNWDTGATGSEITVSPTVTTTYTVTVEDVFGNSETDSVTVTVNETPDITASSDVAIMEGESTVLSASGWTDYEWSTGETTASITVSPTVTTTYTVNVINPSGGCSDTESVTVTVVPELIADAGADVSICSGESTTLSASGGSVYNWNTGATGSEITVSPTATTTYTVTVEDVFGNSETDSVTVTVNETPDITVSSDIAIMEGESTVLSASGWTDYEWSTGETTTSITVSPTVTTTYTVTAINPSGGCSDTESVTVTVIPELIADAGADVTICEGESTTLIASGGISYTWNTGESGSEITVNPNATSTYTVTATDSFGNTDSDSVIVTVNSIPNITVSGETEIVQGESVVLYASGAASYLWNTGEISSSISVSPTQTTTYSVTGTTDACSSDEVFITVEVEAPFEAFAGEDQRVCEDDSNEIVLTANQGDSYLWNTGETTQSISVNPTATSTYSVTVTQGVQEDVDDVTVFVDANPNVVISNGSSVDILTGEFVTLSASGANAYEWNNGATQPNIAVGPSVTTTYEVRGYTGDCYDDQEVTVNVIPEVVADAGEDVTICVEDIVVLRAEGGDEYLWDTGETTQEIEVSPTVTKEYVVTVFNALDFDEDSVMVVVDEGCEDNAAEIPSPDDPLDFDFSIYPNPATNLVNVKLSGSDLLSHIYLYDVTGKLIQKTWISNATTNESSTVEMNISNLQTGLYYVKLVDTNRSVTRKLMVR